jgi:hypothetical protein
VALVGAFAVYGASRRVCRLAIGDHVKLLSLTCRWTVVA